MTIVEISAVVIAATIAAQGLSGIIANVTKTVLMKKAEAEFEKLKTGINLGAQLGAVVGGVLGGGFDHVTGGKLAKKEAELKELERMVKVGLDYIEKNKRGPFSFRDLFKPKTKPSSPAK